MASNNLNLGIRLRCGGQLHAPAALTRDKEQLYPLNRTQCKPQSRYEDQKDILPLSEIKPRFLGRPAASHRSELI
jgi:hypothetical protein